MSGFTLRPYSEYRESGQPWLGRMLRSHTALLRAPYLKQVVLEDWLLDQRLPGRSLVLVPAEIGEASPAGRGTIGGP